MSLPHEVWLDICEEFDRDDLKVLRYINKDFNQACLSKIYRTLYLNELASSVRNAWFIAENPHLARCVTRIVVSEDRFHLTLPNPIVPFEQYSRHWKATRRCEWEPIGGEQVLSEIVSLLPNLEHLVRCQSTYADSFMPDWETRGRWNVSWKLRERLHIFPIERLFKIGSMRMIRSLVLDPVDVIDLSNFGKLIASSAQSHPCLHSLDSLELHICSEDNSIDAKHDLLTRTAFARVFTAAPKIRNLSLNFLPPPLGTAKTLHEQNSLKMRIITALLHQRLSNLRQLSLHHFCCTEADLIFFILSHSPTLQSLTLQHMTFMLDATNPRRLPSIMRFCLTLRETLSLSYFTLNEPIRLPPSDGMGQRHDLEDQTVYQIKAMRPNAENVMEQLCESVCNRADFPVPISKWGSRFDEEGNYLEVDGQYIDMEFAFINLMQEPPLGQVLVGNRWVDAQEWWEEQQDEGEGVEGEAGEEGREELDGESDYHPVEGYQGVIV